MPISSRVIARVAVVALATASVHAALSAQKPAAKANGFELSVDSIMRGPKLVGYPPTGLRWSGDSARLYFEWRRPGEDEPATYVVGRDGGGRDPAAVEGRPFRGARAAARPVPGLGNRRTKVSRSTTPIPAIRPCSAARTSW